MPFLHGIRDVVINNGRLRRDDGRAKNATME
jgi:hypothetical protein